MKGKRHPWAFIVGCFDTTGKVCPTRPKPGRRARKALALPSLTQAPMNQTSAVTVAEGQTIRHYRVCSDPPVMGRHACRDASSITLPAAVTTAALTSVPFMTPGQAPVIIEISEPDETEGK